MGCVLNAGCIIESPREFNKNSSLELTPSDCDLAVRARPGETHTGAETACIPGTVRGSRVCVPDSGGSTQWSGMLPSVLPPCS